MNTAVTDTATLTGTNAATATGMVTYDVYSDTGRTDRVKIGTAETMTTPGKAPGVQCRITSQRHVLLAGVDRRGRRERCVKEQVRDRCQRRRS